MSTTETPDYKTIIMIVRNWPAWQRFDLVKDVLNTLEPTRPMTQERLEAFDKLAGILATDRPPPSDEEVKQWLEEERLKKYG